MFLAGPFGSTAARAYRFAASSVGASGLKAAVSAVVVLSPPLAVSLNMRLFAVRGEMDPWNECHAAVRTALLKRITDL